MWWAEYLDPVYMIKENVSLFDNVAYNEVRTTLNERGREREREREREL